MNDERQSLGGVLLLLLVLLVLVGFVAYQNHQQLELMRNAESRIQQEREEKGYGP